MKNLVSLLTLTVILFALFLGCSKTNTVKPIVVVPNATNLQKFYAGGWKATQVNVKFTDGTTLTGDTAGLKWLWLQGFTPYKPNPVVLRDTTGTMDVQVNLQKQPASATYDWPSNIGAFYVSFDNSLVTIVVDITSISDTQLQIKIGNYYTNANGADVLFTYPVNGVQKTCLEIDEFMTH